MAFNTDLKRFVVTYFFFLLSPFFSKPTVVSLTLKMELVSL